MVAFRAGGDVVSSLVEEKGEKRRRLGTPPFPRRLSFRGAVHHRFRISSPSEMDPPRGTTATDLPTTEQSSLPTASCTVKSDRPNVSSGARGSSCTALPRKPSFEEKEAARKDTERQPPAMRADEVLSTASTSGAAYHTAELFPGDKGAKASAQMRANSKHGQGSRGTLLDDPPDTATRVSSRTRVSRAGSSTGPPVGFRGSQCPCTCRPRPTWFQLLVGSHDARKRHIKDPPKPRRERVVTRDMQPLEWTELSPGTSQKLQRMLARFQCAEESDDAIPWKTQCVYIANAVFFLVIIVLVFVMGIWYVDPSIDVVTRRGRYQGVAIPIGKGFVYSFLGVRFGRPMTDRFRFGIPVPASVQDSLSMSPQSACPQIPEHVFEQVEPGSSEDCLHLNIWTPVLPSKCTRDCELREVVVFLPGRDFARGANSEPMYDGRYFSLYGDLVVVIPNYRLGPLGFLNANLSDCPGNVGLYDQRIAFDWVKENIAAFGGNASKTAVIGHDAGAVSLGYHLVSPEQHWLQRVQRFVFHSSSPLRRFPDNSRGAAGNLNKLSRLFNCYSAHDASRVDCLRRETVGYLLQASLSLEPTAPLFVPSFGTRLLPTAPWLAPELHVSGKDFLLVNVQDEGSYYVHLLLQRMNRDSFETVTESAMQRYIHRLLTVLSIGEHVQTIRDMYERDPSWLLENTTERLLDLWRTILGDLLFTCPMRYFADRLADAKNTVKMVLFSHRPSWKDTSASGHYDDLAFLFGLPMQGVTAAEKAGERELSLRVIGHWSEFIKTGVLPSLSTNEPWPSYSSASPSIVELRMSDDHEIGLGTKQRARQ